MKTNFKLFTYFILFYFFFISNFSWGQNAVIDNNRYPEYKPNIFAPSPSSASLLRFEEVPVNLNTGIPDISENLYNLKVDDNLNISLTLSYHPAGIKVNDISGWVGAGWSLNPSGAITREVRGLSDDNKVYGILSSYNNFLYNRTHLTNVEELNSYRYNSFMKPSGYFDLESDIYYFNFMGRSGKFAFVMNEQGMILPTLIDGDKSYKIEYERDSYSGEFNTFIITDDFGYRFYFERGVKEITNSAMYNTYEHIHGDYGDDPIILPATETPLTIWNLTQVKNYNHQELVHFYYGSYNENKPSGRNLKKNQIIDGMPLSIDFTDVLTQELIYCNAISAMLPKTSTLVSTNSKLTNRLDSISIVDKGKIIFSNSDERLNEIQIKNIKNFLQRKIVFDYDEINVVDKFDQNNEIQRRYLKNFKIYNNNSSNYLNYNLEYNDYLEENFNSFAKDYWEYFNNTDVEPDPNLTYEYGITSTNTNPSVITKGVLKKIIYPTGGTKEFDFESNRFSKILNTPDILLYDIEENRVPFSKVYNFTMFMTQYSYIPTIIFIPNKNNNTNISLSVLNYTPNQIIVNDPLYDTKPYYVAFTPLKIKDEYKNDLKNYVLDWNTTANTNFFSLDISKFDMGTPISVRPGESKPLDIGFYKYEIKYDESLVPYNPVTLQLNINTYRVRNTYKYLYGGGLRIKEIRFKDTQYDSEPKRKFNFYYSDFDDTNKSSGSIINTPVYKYTGTKKWTEITFWNQSLQIHGYRIAQNAYDFINLNGFTPLSQAKGSVVGYQNVKVQSTEGYTKNYFTTVEDMNLNTGEYQYPFFLSEGRDYKSGIKLKEEIYNKNNLKLKEINYTYEFAQDSITLGERTFERNGGCYLQGGYYSYFIKSYNKFKSTLNSDNHVESGMLSPCSDYLSWIGVSNIHAIRGWAQLKEQKEIDFFPSGNLEKDNYFEYNFSNKAVRMEKNITSTGDTTIKIYQYPPDLSSTKPFIDILKGANRISVPIIISSSYKEPLQQSEETSYFETEYAKDGTTNQLVLPKYIYTKKGADENTLEKKITYNQYDDKGNILQYTLENGTPVSIIWGYNQQYPIAKIEGVEYSSVQNYVTNLQTLSNADTDSGFNAPTEGQLITALNALRNTFSDSMVTTYTYDPLIGVTTITAPNGFTEYYLYDSFGRLQKIVDKEGKELKKYEYNYKQ